MRLRVPGVIKYNTMAALSFTSVLAACSWKCVRVIRVQAYMSVCVCVYMCLSKWMDEWLRGLARSHLQGKVSELLASDIRQHLLLTHCGKAAVCEFELSCCRWIMCERKGSLILMVRLCVSHPTKNGSFFIFICYGRHVARQEWISAAQFEVW